MSQNSASRVGEIFSAAGLAFSRLGELSMTLHSGDQSSSGSGKWDVDDVEQLRQAVKRFGEELNRISDNIKNKTIVQLKSGMKRKAVDEANKSNNNNTSSNKKLNVASNQRSPSSSSSSSSSTKIVKLSPQILNEVDNNGYSDPQDGQLTNSLVQVKSCN